MRKIHIANSKKRDAEVGFESPKQKEKVRYVLPDGSERKNISMLKATMALTEEALAAQYNGDYLALGQALINSDPEIDMEVIGKFVGRSHRLYLDKNNKVVYNANFYQVRKNPKGEELDRKDLTHVPANINVEEAISWTGQKFPKQDILRKFVFTRKYQIRHVSGLTFDFLYDMAKELHDTNSMMRVGAGKKGNERLVITTGGDGYFGFLEGRVEGEKFCLILHLTNMELKGVSHEIE